MTVGEVNASWAKLGALKVRPLTVDDPSQLEQAAQARQRQLARGAELFEIVCQQIATDLGLIWGGSPADIPDDTEISEAAELRFDEYFAHMGNCLFEGETRRDRILGDTFSEAGLPKIHWKVEGKKFVFETDARGSRTILGGTILSFELNAGEGLVFYVSTPFLFGKRILSLHRAHGQWLMRIEKGDGANEEVEFVSGSVEFE